MAASKSSRFTRSSRWIIRSAWERAIASISCRSPASAEKAPPATPARDQQVISGRNPFDGATVVNLSPAVADELGLDPFVGKGVLVTNIGRGFAMNAGLRPGDLIRRVNGREINTVRDLTAQLVQSGGQWQVTIERNGQEVTANFRT